jgi:hypothetical protein
MDQHDFTGWQANRRGCLTEEVFGYALALLAYMRGERNPAWSRYLGGSVITYSRMDNGILKRQVMPAN